MIILASSSPTRQSMLMNAGLLFSAVKPDVDERALVARNPQWAPEEMALKLAEAKAVDVSSRNPAAFVIGADQVLALNGKTYVKPLNVSHCREQILELRGKTHALISGIVCARYGKVTWGFSDHAVLTMRNFSEAFLDSYLEKIGSDCTSSVGGYKIESLGLQLFDAVKGDHFTILGLPLIPLLDYLRREGEIPA
jgi:septum formation protein